MDQRQPGLERPWEVQRVRSRCLHRAYPAGWASAGSPRTGVTFRPPSGTEKVVVTTAPKLAGLPAVKQGNGVAEVGSKQVVACGVTARLYTYSTATAGHYLASLVLPEAVHHYLGLEATLSSLSQLVTVMRFVNSLAFPFPICIGGPPATTKAHPKSPHLTTTSSA